MGKGEEETCGQVFIKSWKGFEFRRDCSRKGIAGVSLVVNANEYIEKGAEGIPDAVLDNIEFVDIAKAAYEWGSGKSLFPSETEKMAEELLEQENELGTEIWNAKQKQFAADDRIIKTWYENGQQGPPPSLPSFTPLPPLPLPQTPPTPTPTHTVNINPDAPAVTAQGN